MSKTILVVDDDQELQELVSFALKRAGYDVRQALNAFEGLEIIEKEEIDLALLDIMMPKMDGLEMLSRLRTNNKDLPVIVMTALAAPEAAISAMREQACDFLEKPFDVQQLLSAVRTAFELAPRELRIEVLSASPEWIELRVPCDLAAIDPLERLMSNLKTDLPAQTRETITYAFREIVADERRGQPFVGDHPMLDRMAQVNQTLIVLRAQAHICREQVSIFRPSKERAHRSRPCG